MPLEKFNLPVGRIVNGNPARAEVKTNFQTKKPVLDAAGQQIMESRCKIAFPKDVFLREIYPHMVNVAKESYPSVDPQTGLPKVPRDFSWKFVDGDSPECPKNSTTPYNARKGYPGHYVLDISTEAFIPKVWKQQNGGFYEVKENELKTGDYVVANVDIKSHSNNDGGLYINPNLFELVGIGEEIKGSGGMNPEQAFGSARNYQLPAGAQPVGTAPTMPVAAPQPVAPMPMAPTPVQPMMPQMQPPAAMPMAAPSPQPMAGAPLPPPAHDFVQNMGMPAAPQPVAAPYAPSAMPAPQPASLPVATHAATNATSFHTNMMPALPQR